MIDAVFEADNNIIGGDDVKSAATAIDQPIGKPLVEIVVWVVLNIAKIKVGLDINREGDVSELLQWEVDMEIAMEYPLF